MMRWLLSWFRTTDRDHLELTTERRQIMSKWQQSHWEVGQ